MAKFNVGDRVAVYDVDYYGNTDALEMVDRVKVKRDTGEILKISTDKKCGFVQCDSGAKMTWVSLKQCRRLMKKRRRTIWVKSPSGQGFRYWETMASDTPDCLKETDFRDAVEFREVTRK